MRAHVDPDGPPPTTIASQRIMSCLRVEEDLGPRQNGGADSRGVKTTWKSCIHPVAKAACDPAR